MHPILRLLETQQYKSEGVAEGPARPSGLLGYAPEVRRRRSALWCSMSSRRRSVSRSSNSLSRSNLFQGPTIT